MASFAGFTPFRTDTADKPTGGLARLSDLHALIPRLGWFVDEPAKVPYDYGELLGAIVGFEGDLAALSFQKSLGKLDERAPGWRAAASWRALWRCAGAGHNDLMHADEYFATLRSWLAARPAAKQ